jgi:hypothetical protein
VIRLAVVDTECGTVKMQVTTKTAGNPLSFVSRPLPFVLKAFKGKI